MLSQSRILFLTSLPPPQGQTIYLQTTTLAVVGRYIYIMQILQANTNTHTHTHIHDEIKMGEKPIKGKSSQKYFDKSAPKHTCSFCKFSHNFIQKTNFILSKSLLMYVNFPEAWILL